ncbi:phasin family protein [Desulfuromonas sp. KJ2020]|uniref:phasin family protein n=1 Tax=Desulfuromonas sp. KJ2020 TaxID=2919173 RepID=UPI0020A77194|nr:phasin family protein [Desulfuromonas sp. KJ2020]MCP3177086.1 phasin family protein [Desulfuromonas sp. KJ2020]
MLEFLEKTLFTTVGAVALSQKRAEELLKEMKERFDITEEEGKAFLSNLQEKAKENQQKLEQAAREEVKKACERAGVVTTDEFEKLRKKVAQLEKLVKDQG